MSRASMTTTELDVGSHEVVPYEATDRRQLAERTVSAVMIVEVQVGIEKGLPLRRGAEGEAIGPLAQKRLNEPFRFAVGARRVGPRSGVANTKGATEAGERMRLVG